jgi:hypothetical protein
MRELALRFAKAFEAFGLGKAVTARWVGELDE